MQQAPATERRFKSHGLSGDCAPLIVDKHARAARFGIAMARLPRIPIGTISFHAIVKSLE